MESTPKKKSESTARTLTKVTVIIVIIFAAISVLDKINASKNLDNKSSSVPEIGERIKSNNYIISAESILDPHIVEDFLSEPKDGNRYIAIEVLYENESNESITAEYYDWSVSDSNSFVFQPIFVGSKDPKFDTTEIPTGEKLRGWITFEVPKDSRDFTLRFQSEKDSQAGIKIELF